MKTTRKRNLMAIALFCALGITGLFPAKVSAATVVVRTGPGRYYYHGSYYKYHYGRGYYNYYYRNQYYLYYNRGSYYNNRIWVVSSYGRPAYYRYW